MLTLWQSKILLQKDADLLKGHNISYKFYLNLTPGEINVVRHFFYRLRSRVAAEMQRFFKIGTRWAVSHAPAQMLKKALDENATLYVAHLESAFYTGRDLLKAGKKVSYDFEDWYSHDYLVPQRAVKLLNEVERYALTNGLFCTTTSNKMAAALNTHHRLNKDISVIYNGFPEAGFEQNTAEVVTVRNDGRVRLLWFSRNIGPNRGLEFLLVALKVCKIPVELHLLGMMEDGYEDYLNKNFPYESNHKLVLHSFLPHHHLASFISQFDIGLAIEENLNDNKTLTISNKILQYLQAGLPVLASDTQGQREVAEFFPATIKILDINNALEWEKAIGFLSNVDKSARENQKFIYEKIFSWKAQENKLNNLIAKYL